MYLVFDIVPSCFCTNSFVQSLESSGKIVLRNYLQYSCHFFVGGKTALFLWQLLARKKSSGHRCNEYRGRLIAVTDFQPEIVLLILTNVPEHCQTPIVQVSVTSLEMRIESRVHVFYFYFYQELRIKQCG